MEQTKSARTKAKVSRAAPEMTVILRDVPPTYDWGWFSREDQRMHLQSVDKDHWFFHYKVWLEEKGRKVIEPELGIPAKVLSVLKKEIQVQRGRIEAYWIAFMIKNGWLRCHLRNGLIILRAYPNTPNHFERSIKLSEIIPNEEVARKVTPQDVVLNEEFAMLEIFPRREESSRVHERLEDLLWRG